MKLSELITRIGDENVIFQLLADSTTNVNTNKKGVSLITFATDQTNATAVLHDDGKIGFVVWFPRPAFEAATKDLRLKAHPPSPNDAMKNRAACLALLQAHGAPAALKGQP